MIFLEYPKCSTCKEIKRYLEIQQVTFKSRNIVIDNPSVVEIQRWHELSGLDIKKFFNTSGVKYRELELKDKLPTMSLAQKYELLASDGILVKRPILVDKQKVLIGRDIYKSFG